MFDPDIAIESCEEDKLNRCDFAKSLGEAIVNYRDEESLVIGLLGKWGYGKTSIINMAIEHIKGIATSNKDPPIVMEFNPWIFSNQNQLVKKFFDELSIKIDDSEINKGLKSYVNKLIPPIIGVASIIDPVRTKALIENAEYFDDAIDESLESIKNKLNKLIKTKKKKIVIVIDDIDRLNDYEVQQIFQLVKLLANFPNTTYLLSFDRTIVINALNQVQKDSAENYLEKIVQIPFEVPKIPNENIERLLFNQINEAIFEVEDRFNENHWWNLYYGGLKYFFNSIRDAKRYSNILKFNFQLIKNEVNVADFLAITCIQVFTPNVYYAIRDNKDLFTGVFDFQVAGASTIPKEENAKERCDKIIENANESLKEPLKSLLIQLFPKLGALYHKTNYGSDWLGGWRKDLRICSSDIFDIYFKLSIPKDELTQSRVKSIVALSNDADSFKKAILNVNKEKKIVQLFERIEDYTSEIPELNIGIIIQTLMDIGDFLDDGYSSMLAPDTQMRILRIIYQLIFRFGSQNKRFEILENAIKNTKLSIYPIVHEISVQDQEHGKYGFAKKPSKSEELRTINSKQLVYLENLVCDKIREWAENGELLKNRNLDDILFVWQKWASEEEVDEFIKKSIVDDEGLVQFITGFIQKTSNWNLSNQFENQFWRINLKYMEESFIDPKSFKTRIKELSIDKKLNEYNKLAIKLYLENIDNY